MSAAFEIVWCGARNGRDATSPQPGGSSPATECTAVTSSASSERQRRQNTRHPPRDHRLAGAGRSHEQQVVRSGARDFQRPAWQKLSADVGESRRVADDGGGAGGGTGATLAGSFNARTASASDETARRRAPNDRRLARVRRRQQDARDAFAARRRRDRQHPAGGWRAPSSESSPITTRPRSRAVRQRLAPRECPARSADRRPFPPCARRPAPDSR